MGFELTVAAKRDSRQGYGSKVASLQHYVSATIVLNGQLDNAAVDAVLATVIDAIKGNADSILIVMDDVTLGATSCLETFASAMMVLRDARVHIQVCATDVTVHSTMSRVIASHRWLLGFSSRAQAEGVALCNSSEGLSKCGVRS